MKNITGICILFMNFNLFAQEEAPQKSMKITIEINEDGKTKKDERTKS